uniref:Uncharacterized protein n=1 Tax=Cannabis sativa TaxID=3483 RepID=A0A803PV20_CANSA
MTTTLTEIQLVFPLSTSIQSIPLAASRVILRLKVIHYVKDQINLPQAPPFDPHISRLATREVLNANQYVESSDSESKVEEVVPVKRRQYMSCSVILNSPLRSYNEVEWPLNRLCQPSLVGVNHILGEAQVLD